MNVPQLPKFDLLELSWWEYPQVWIGVSIVSLLLLLVGAYWWWLRLQKARRPKTPVELLLLQLVELERLVTRAPQTYQEQKRFYEILSLLLQAYMSFCVGVSQAEMTDAERLDWMREHCGTSDFVMLCEIVIMHGQQVKFARQTLDPDIVRTDVTLMIDRIRKELERCQ